jgi:hypothetical protein
MASSLHQQFPVLFPNLFQNHPGQTVNYKENASSSKMTKTVCMLVLSRAIKCHFKIWLDCHKLKISLPDCAHVNKVSKNEKKLRINVIQHDDRL